MRLAVADRLQAVKSAFYLYIRKKAEKVTNGGEEECDTAPEKLKFTAKQPPEEDSGPQSGER